MLKNTYDTIRLWWLRHTSEEYMTQLITVNQLKNEDFIFVYILIFLLGLLTGAATMRVYCDASFQKYLDVTTPQTTQQKEIQKNTVEKNTVEKNIIEEKKSVEKSVEKPKERSILKKVTILK